MNPRRLFNLLIALTVAAGLLSAPFAAPSMAMPHQATAAAVASPHIDHAAISDDQTADAMGAMAGDMPCCPDEGKPAKDCNSCPWLALCSLSIATPVPSGAAVLVPGLMTVAAFAFPDDLLMAGLGARPPDHPPRSI